MQRDEIEMMVMHPYFAASELDRTEHALEDLEQEMRVLISNGMLHLRNQA
jgi:hypothetical protein